MLRQIVFLDGKFVVPKEARVSALNEGFLYGWGIFETMRSYNNNILYFKKHIERAKQASRFLNIRFVYPVARIEGIIKKLVERNCLYDACIRLTLWKEGSQSHLLVVAKPYHPYPLQKYRSGFSACIAQYRQNEDSVIAGIKSSNRLLYELAYAQAKHKNCDEALILNSRGYLTEASRSNIFMEKDNHIFTPSLECGCLAGVTRQVIFDMADKYNIKVYDGKFTPRDLLGSGGAFLTNSLMGVMPLAKLEDKVIPKGKLTSFFVSRYRQLLENGN